MILLVPVRDHYVLLHCVTGTGTHYFNTNFILIFSYEICLMHTGSVYCNFCYMYSVILKRILSIHFIRIRIQHKL